MKQTHTLVCTAIYFIVLYSMPNTLFCQEGKIPCSAKGAYNFTERQLQYKGLSKAKLIYATTEAVKASDTILVKKAKDTVLGIDCLEWNGYGYSWYFYFRSDSVGKDSLLLMQTYIDSASRGYVSVQSTVDTLTLAWYGFMPPDSVAIVDSTWIDSRSAATIPRVQNFDGWCGLFEIYDHSATTVHCMLTRQEVYHADSNALQTRNLWLFRDYNNQSFGFDALTGELFLAGVVSVEKTPSNQQDWCYPNPATETIRLQGIEGCAVSIYSALGESVVNIPQYDNSTISVSHLPNGSYYVRCITTKGTIVQSLMILR